MRIKNLIRELSLFLLVIANVTSVMIAIHMLISQVEFMNQVKLVLVIAALQVFSTILALMSKTVSVTKEVIHTESPKAEELKYSTKEYSYY
jgi:hypothetical protein